MNKANDKYLDPVIELYKGFISKGEIIPLEFNFPSFKVSKGVFNFYAVDALSERVKIGVDAGTYGLQKYHSEISYDELLDYTDRKKVGFTTPAEDQTTGLLIEKILTEKIRQDTTMTASEARNGALLGSCVKTMEYKVQELINIEHFKPDSKISTREITKESQANDLIVGTQERIDFIATLVSMKEVLPQIHRKVLQSLTDRQIMSEDSTKHYVKIKKDRGDTVDKNDINDKILEIGIAQNRKIVEFICEIKDAAANPNTTVLNRALEVDPSLSKIFIEKYPRIMKEVLQENARKGNKFNM